MATSDIAPPAPPVRDTPTSEPAVPRRPRAVSRLVVLARVLVTAAVFVVSLPPFGWWPLAFVAIALWDRLLADTTWAQRFRRTWLITFLWFGLSSLWVWDFSPPGFIGIMSLYATYFAVAAAVVPPHRPARWIALPGAVVLASQAMWISPFGGTPMAHLAIGQATSCAPPACTPHDSPLPQAARLAGPLLVVALVVIGGLALSAAWERRWKAAGVAVGIVAVTTVLGVVAPRGYDTGSTVRVAIVQGGGPQHTAIGNLDAPEVFRAHLDATFAAVTQPVDVVLWPENTVTVYGQFEGSDAHQQLAALAAAIKSPIIAGVTEDQPDGKTFLNAAVVVNVDGTVGKRFDKVQRVPFGEYVPLRPLVEPLAGSSGIPARDAVAGNGTGSLDTPAGRFAMLVSWETFFSERAREGVNDGGEILMNPTNGASYWLTEVQTQQIATSRLRAIENGRWLVQAAPTGFSAVITADGALLQRTDVSERKVIIADIPKRSGRTLASYGGNWPAIVLAAAALALAWRWSRRGRPGAPAGGVAEPTDPPNEDAEPHPAGR